MGFGYRIYRVRAPRAEVLAEAVERPCTTDGDKEFYALALDVEKAASRLLAEHEPGRNLQTNVVFYTALPLHGLPLPTELFTPTFAVERPIGPRSEYVGGQDGRWVLPADRSTSYEPSARTRVLKAEGSKKKRPPEKSGGRTLLSVTQVSRLKARPPSLHGRRIK